MKWNRVTVCPYSNKCSNKGITTYSKELLVTSAFTFDFWPYILFTLKLNFNSCAVVNTT